MQRNVEFVDCFLLHQVVDHGSRFTCRLVIEPLTKPQTLIVAHTPIVDKNTRLTSTQMEYIPPQEMMTTSFEKFLDKNLDPDLSQNSNQSFLIFPTSLKKFNENSSAFIWLSNLANREIDE